MLKIFHENDLVIVTFHAPWCGPCRLMKKELAEVGDQLGEKVKMVRVDTEKWPKLAVRYQVTRLPTIVLFKNDIVSDRFERVMSVEELVQHIQAILN